MSLRFSKVAYASLNARQKENFNFQKISAVLADYGFSTLRLSDDWQGADFIAQHLDGETFLKVQLKGRLLFDKKYLGKSLHIAFYDIDDWFLYPHDELLQKVLAETNVAQTQSWIGPGSYSFPSLSRQMREWLEPYRIVGDTKSL